MEKSNPFPEICSFPTLLHWFVGVGVKAVSAQCNVQESESLPRSFQDSLERHFSPMFCAFSLYGGLPLFPARRHFQVAKNSTFARNPVTGRGQKVYFFKKGSLFGSPLDFRHAVKMQLGREAKHRPGLPLSRAAGQAPARPGRLTNRLAPSSRPGKFSAAHETGGALPHVPCGEGAPNLRNAPPLFPFFPAPRCIPLVPREENFPSRPGSGVARERKPIPKGAPQKTRRKPIGGRMEGA